MAVRGRASFRSRGQKRGEHVLRGLNDEIHWKRFYDFLSKIGRFRRKSTSERNVETLMKWKLVLLWKYRVNISRIENRRVIFRSLKKIYIHIYVPDEK